MASPPSPSETISFGEFHANLHSRELSRQGSRIRLPDQAFQVLAMLLEHPGELVTREEFRKRLWPADTFVDFDHGLNNAVNRLREALADSATVPRFVETLPRRGYRFIGDINSAPRVQSVPASVELRIEPPQLPPKSTHKWGSLRVWIWAGAAVCAILLIALWMRLGDLHSVPPIRSLAVLPLDNLSGDPSQEYLADGITDALITDLANIRSLRLVSRTSAMHYKGSRKPLSEISRELNVDAVVEGSVARFGSRVGVNIQLIQTANDRHLWAKSYEQEVGDIMELQNTLAVAISQELAVNLGPEERLKMTKVRPTNAEAFEAYLKGRFYWNKRTVPALQTAKGYFEEATQKDPHYALAYAGLADVYDVLGSGVAAALPPREAMRQARQAAMKAIQLDESLAEGHTSLAGIKFSFDWDWAGAESEFRRAIELNPNDVTAHFWYAQLLLALGRWDESLASDNRAAHLDPVAPIFVEFRGAISHNARQYEKATEQMKEALRLDPNYFLIHYDLGRAYEQLGSYERAVSEFQKAVELSGGDMTSESSLAHVYAVSGQKAKAEEILNELKQKVSGNNLSYQIADIYIGLGQQDQAFEWLEKAYQERSGWLTWIAIEPKLDPLRSDPRFTNLLRRMNLPSSVPSVNLRSSSEPKSRAQSPIM
jgi:TolB-like protein/DNA-binding winged helix-turn-helix (wHTH) protein/Tfp pilus assembly protein PilF